LSKNFIYKRENDFENLITILFNNDKNGLFIGGNINKVFLYDLNSMKIKQSSKTNEGICKSTLAGRYSSILCTAGINGNIHIRDPKSLQVTNIFNLYNGTISDIDSKGDYLGKLNIK
jgi:hypothetical protein